MSNRPVIISCTKPVVLLLAMNWLAIELCFGAPNYYNPQQNSTNRYSPVANENSIEYDDNQLTSHGLYPNIVPCGSIASNLTRIIVKNPHHPEATYTKAICETVVERAHPMVKRLNINFKRFELYRANYDGSCSHDRFGVYNDFNVAISPIICGTQTGSNISIPFVSPQSSLIVSVTTSDLDHDRYWILEIQQEK